MENKRLAIYPFSEECMVFSDHTDLIDEGYIFAEAAAPAVWETCGKSIRTSEGEYIIKKSPSEFESDADVLLIPEFELVKRAERGFVTAIVNYIPKVSKVIYYGKFSDESKEKIISRCRECGCEFDDRRRHEKGSLPEVYTEEVQKHDVPIIAVTGFWENTGKMNVLLSLKSKFMNDGYKVEVISPRGYSDLFGCSNFPDFMYAEDVSERIKPLLFNKYISDIITEKEPDIILVGVPGAVQMLTEKYTNGFGVLPYITLQGFVSDFTIVCGFFDGYTPEFYDEVSKMFHYRYGIDPDIYHMSRMYIDISESDENENITAHNITKESVKEVLDELSGNTVTPVLDLTIDENIDNIYSMMIGKLTGDTRVIV